VMDFWIFCSCGIRVSWRFGFWYLGTMSGVLDRATNGEEISGQHDSGVSCAFDEFWDSRAVQPCNTIGIAMELSIRIWEKR